MIQGLSDKLCDDVPCIDEETGIKYVVVSVERNACSGLVVKGKPYLKFNGLGACVAYSPIGEMPNREIRHARTYRVFPTYGSERS